MNEEKFISIEYETWKKKYLHLEEEVSRLRIELANEKENKAITFRIGTYSVYQINRNSYQTNDIAYLEPMGDSNAFQLKEVKNAIEFLGHKIGSRYGIFTSEKAARHMCDTITNAQSVFRKEKEDVLKERKENERIISKIPRLIKWLFKIK